MTWKLAKSVFLVLLFLMVAGVVVAMGSFGPARTEMQAQSDYRSVSERLVDRAALTREGEVQYRLFRFSIDPELFASLAELLESSQNQARVSVVEQVQDWLDSNLPENREAWSGSCGFDHDRWKDERRRIGSIDTSHSHLAAATVHEPGSVVPPVQHVVRFFDGGESFTVRDGRAVLIHPVRDFYHPLAPIDISLAPWEDAIEHGASVDGQTIAAFVNGGLHTISYRNECDADKQFRTDYVFNAELNWAPALVRSTEDGAVIQRYVYGYDPQDRGSVARPAVVAKGNVSQAGDIDVTLWMIDEWEEVCRAESVQFHLPAIYFEVDLRYDSHRPTTVLRQPDYLRDAEPWPCEGRFHAALMEVLTAFGTSEDLSADFVYDGVIDERDLYAVVERFGSLESMDE